MAKTARATIVPFWYNMNGTTEELRDAEEQLGKEPGALGEPEQDDTPFEVQLKPLNGMEQLSLKDHMFVDRATGNVDYTADGFAKAIQMGLIGWRNYNNQDGTPMDFSVSAALDNLDKDDLRLIAYQVIMHSTVSEDLRKK